MNHAEALETQFVERYLLGELTEAETEAFEQHYFACPECAADVATATLLKANARAVFRDEAEPHREAEPRRAGQSEKLGIWQRFFSPFQAPPALAAGLASLVLAAGGSYQLLVLTPRLKQELQQAYAPVALSEFTLTGVTRGELPVVRVPGEARFFSVSFDVDPGLPYREYRCDLKDGAGSIRLSLHLSPPPAGKPIVILLPARRLEAGKYDLSLTGQGAPGNGETQVGNYAFNLQIGPDK
jgi:hypothetical protein